MAPSGRRAWSCASRGQSLKEGLDGRLALLQRLMTSSALKNQSAPRLASVAQAGVVGTLSLKFFGGAGRGTSIHRGQLIHLVRGQGFRLVKPRLRLCMSLDCCVGDL
mmetsp:Transcript_8894/g.21049  ORF Transcript_8894/g.21049 Transcript_8894/m.21049 type:complete len:107 (-) Transcript_8894:86-406(-)